MSLDWLPTAIMGAEGVAIGVLAFLLYRATSKVGGLALALHAVDLRAQTGDKYIENLKKVLEQKEERIETLEEVLSDLATGPERVSIFNKLLQDSDDEGGNGGLSN